MVEPSGVSSNLTARSDLRNIYRNFIKTSPSKLYVWPNNNCKPVCAPAPVHGEEVFENFCSKTKSKLFLELTA